MFAKNVDRNAAHLTKTEANELYAPVVSQTQTIFRIYEETTRIQNTVNG